MQDDPIPPAPLPEERREASRTGRKLSVRPSVIVAALVAAALIIFVVQNSSRVPVNWLFVQVDGPLWAVIIVAAVAGAVLSQVLGWVVARSRRRRKDRP